MSTYKKYLSLILTVICCLLSACEPKTASGKGLYLPEGNIGKGKQAFIDLNCHQCHTVTGVELPQFALETPLISLELGGKLYRVKTYGELITSITNPNHIVSQKYLQVLSKSAKEETDKSPMLSSNDIMTVTQLIDLVTFLDANYMKFDRDYYH